MAVSQVLQNIVIPTCVYAIQFGKNSHKWPQIKSIFSLDKTAGQTNDEIPMETLIKTAINRNQTNDRIKRNTKCKVTQEDEMKAQ